MREIYSDSERPSEFINKTHSTMALIKEYFALTEKYTTEYGSNTVVLLQVGAFFEVYGQIITSPEGSGGGSFDGAQRTVGNANDCRDGHEYIFH